MKVVVSEVELEPLPPDPTWGWWRRLTENSLSRVMKPFTVDIGQGDHRHVIEVPAGLVTDGASIPRFLQPLFFDSVVRGVAAIVHDNLYKSGEVGKVMCDAILKGLIIDLGEAGEIQAEMVFLGVHLFGFIAWNKHRREDK